MNGLATNAMQAGAGLTQSPFGQILTNILSAPEGSTPFDTAANAAQPGQPAVTPTASEVAPPTVIQGGPARQETPEEAYFGEQPIGSKGGPKGAGFSSEAAAQPYVGNKQVSPAVAPQVAPAAPATDGWDGASDPIDYVTDRIIGVESGGRADAKNPNSSAAGVGQFIDSTWLSTIQKHRPDLWQSMNRQQLLALKTDRALGREMTKALTNDSAEFLRNSRLQVTPGNLYLAHFAGTGGARAILTADPSAPVASVLGQDVIRANPFLKGMTAGDLRAWADRKMNQKVRSLGGSGTGTPGSLVSAPTAMNDIPASKRGTADKRSQRRGGGSAGGGVAQAQDSGVTVYSRPKDFSALMSETQGRIAQAQQRAAQRRANIPKVSGPSREG